MCLRPCGEIVVKFAHRINENLGWEEGNIKNVLDLGNPRKSIFGLRDPDEIVIPFEKICVEFDYPLNKPIVYVNQVHRLKTNVFYRYVNLLLALFCFNCFFSVDFLADTQEGFTRGYVARCVFNAYKRIWKEEKPFILKTLKEYRKKVKLAEKQIAKKEEKLKELNIEIPERKQVTYINFLYFLLKCKKLDSKMFGSNGWSIWNLEML